MHRVVGRAQLLQQSTQRLMGQALRSQRSERHSPYFSRMSIASTSERMMLRRDRAPTSLPSCTTGTFLMRLEANRAHTSSTGVVASTEITRRVATAMRLLAETEESVAQVARLVGYELTGSFIRLFKKEIGMTPGQYRDSVVQREK